MVKKLPEFLKKYFWDVNFVELDGEKRPYFVISRIVDKGDLEAVLWVTKNYSGEKIKQSIKVSRELSRSTAKFWTRMLTINEEEVACLRKPYSQTHFEPSN